MSDTSAKSNMDHIAKKATSAVRNKATDAKKVAEETAKNLYNRAEEFADDAVETGRQNAQQLADTGVSKTEEVIRSVGRAIEAGSRSLEADGMGRTASYVRAAAVGLDRAAEEVDAVDTRGLTHRVENFVRDQPLLTVGALALAGFALAGALKNKRN